MKEFLFSLITEHLSDLLMFIMVSTTLVVNILKGGHQDMSNSNKMIPSNEDQIRKIFDDLVTTVLEYHKYCEQVGVDPLALLKLFIPGDDAVVPSQSENNIKGGVINGR